MIYEFKSRATGSVVMTQEIGELMLKAIGKAPGPTGIITVAEMPAALAALRNPAAGGAPDDTPPGGKSDDDGDAKDVAEPISFSQRAWPLIQMIEQAHKAGKDITWGV